MPKSKELKMPNRDGTGPEGKGPRTGRQMGNCKDVKPIAGRRLGLGRWLGRGFRRQNQTAK